MSELNIDKNELTLFSESNTELDSCKIYVIEGTVSERAFQPMYEIHPRMHA